MIQQLIAFWVKNRVLAIALAIGIGGWGLWAARQIPLDAVPDITNNQLQIITRAPSYATAEVERFITYPVELAVQNLPGVTEIRSVSRLGLSVVTVVFEESMGTYLPRQLVGEALSRLGQQMPPGVEAPTMGPISTGLGEIYHYTLEVDSAHAGQYSLMELRSMQDWIVKRQLGGIEGVVEVNSIGGYLKQYEVALDPERLRRLGITAPQVITALESHNQNTGGSYIEKGPYYYFIRGEGMITHLAELEAIAVGQQGQRPVLVRDVATVRLGHAPRFGALSTNGGERAGGIVMMLKGANSSAVVSAVKEKVAQINKSLPEGVQVEPYLDRTKLVSRTTATVGENLALGGLIVVLVLVLLLGNWRAGLIVASTIPLSFCFALGLMQAFGVSANLMSLGALDFGILIDGAVIIVEMVVLGLAQGFPAGQKLPLAQRQTLVIDAASGMMRAAFFGQLIIMIVYVPILTLEGIEGKMFGPMAKVVIFALLGVIVLCFTYVPAMSAWLLNRSPRAERGPGAWLMKQLEKGYVRGLRLAMRLRWALLLAVLGVGVGCALLFTRMGAVFIPDLEEGDLAIHQLLPPGSSLSKSVEVSYMIQDVLTANFPEVEKVVTKIGTPEIPTDPMSMETGDVFVILKPKAQWVSASTKEGLFEAMEAKLREIPGMEYEFTQPIQMRFNELMTGIRADVAIKIFGEDLELLASQGQQVQSLIQGIPGVADVQVERVTGLPQLTVNYRHAQLTRYGLTVTQLNALVRTAFGGHTASVAFEGERRFDVVLRLAPEYREDPEALRQLPVPLADGGVLPLQALADIGFESAPMQVSRDNTQRRIVIGVNVRDRDVQSVITDIRTALNDNLALPPGYYVTYGGVFENLERARARLGVVVPVALGAIFVLLFLALGSVRQTLLIALAIPFAGMGGLLALYLRGMPLSISAGVGFIALSGIAVLNGLVLMSRYNTLRAQGMGHLGEVVRQGSRSRLRPILLTASTDILGFLPMALSLSDGAEVQRPLATVVIGGLVSATLLTLFVLPLLYTMAEGRSKGSLQGNTNPHSQNNLQPETPDSHA